MPSFIDPRNDPPPRARPSSKATTDLETLQPLHELCRRGQLYEVETWIAGGGPLQLTHEQTPRGRRRPTAMEIAVEDGNHSLVRLLLCNGYDLALENPSPLNAALSDRRWDLVDLLLDWGADPQAVDLEDLFSTYSTPLFDRFRAFGVDFTRDHAIAEHLSEHPGNKPLFGFCKRHRSTDPGIQNELNIALVHHADSGHEKGAHLCLWAGADPHEPAIVLRSYRGEDADDAYKRSAVDVACARGFAGLLEKFGPGPGSDDFDELYAWAASSAVIDVLARRSLPADVESIILHKLWWGTISRDGHWDALDMVEHLFGLGLRWERSSPESLARIRKELVRLGSYDFVRWMRLLAKDDYTAPEILHELGLAPTIRRKLSEVGVIPPDSVPSRETRYRPTGSREVLKKFGIELPKKQHERPLPPLYHIGSRQGRKRAIRTTREALFDELWTQPISKLAASWGLSGPGVAKACRRLRIPLPTRGYWAKARAGKRLERRPSLPALGHGQATEVIIWARKHEETTP